MWNFIKFALVGGTALLLDSLLFLTLNHLLNNLLLSRLIAFWGAASFTWLGNSYLTFDDRSGRNLKQWFKHLLACHIAGSANIGSFVVLSAYITPIAALVCGAVTGMLLNFTIARRWIFNTVD